MKKKYIFFDIDGTLTDNTAKKIVPSAQKTLNRLQKTGYFVAIATGRAHYKAGGFIEASGLHNMVCCRGDGLVTDDGLIMNTPLDRQRAVAIYKGTRALGYGALVMLDDSIDMYNVGDRSLRQYGERKEPANYIFHTDFDIDQVRDIYKLYISVPKEEEHRLAREDTLGNLRFVGTYLMLQHDRKKGGILDMMERLDDPVEDIIVFGSDYSGLVMFNDAWFSIAMGNTCGALKKKVGYVTKCDVDDGIYKAHLKFEWTSWNFDLSGSIRKRRFIYYRLLVDLGNFKQKVQHFYQ